MFKVLLYKELKNILLTFQFQFFTIVSTVIGITYIILGLSSYRLQQEDYNSISITNRENVENINVYSQLRQVVAKKPNLLSIFCKGDSHSNLTCVEISPFDTINNFQEGISSNSYLTELFGFDFSKIIAILLSLLALLLSYKAITEEYENGTLKLLLSNDLLRWKIIFSKIFLYQLAITISLVVILLFTLIILIMSNHVNISNSELLRLFIMFIYYELYLLIFVLFGCLCSVICNKSSVSLLVCLFFWLFMIVIIPAGAAFIAKSTYEAKAEINIKENIKHINDKIESDISKWYRQNPPPGAAYRFGHYEEDPARHEIVMRGVREEYKEWCQNYYSYTNQLYIESNQDICSNYIQIEKIQETSKRLADKLSSISLLSLLESAIQRLSLTSYDDYVSFRTYVNEYRKNLIRYIDSKKGFTSRRWFTDDPEGTEPIVVNVDSFNAAALWSDKEAQQKMFLAIYIHKEDKARKLVLKDIPNFKYYDLSILDAFKSFYTTTIVFLLLIGILFFLNFILFNNYSLAK